MKRNIFLTASLLGAMVLTGCVKEQLIPEKQAKEGSVWTVRIQAAKSDAPDTKGLEIEGDEATTTTLKSIWKDNEPVKVYLGTECIGTLTATPDGEDPHKATLSGEVVTSGPEAGVSTLTLITPRAEWDYTSQAGILLAADNSIEKMYHYAAAVNVLVTEVDGSTKTPITTESVTIASADPFFVALRNGDETDAEELSFTVVDTDGVTYKGTKTIPAAYKPNGTFVSMKNVTLNQRLGVSLSATEVTTAW